MKRTTNFIIIEDADLDNGMPTHFTPKYGKLNPDTERMNKRSWGELIVENAIIPNGKGGFEEYKLGHGGTPQINIDGTLCHIVGLRLDFLDGDYEAACEYGQGKDAPFGEVLSWQKAEELLNKYQIKE